jgi:hypothetical protein
MGIVGSFGRQGRIDAMLAREGRGWNEGIAVASLIMLGKQMCGLTLVATTLEL